MSKVFLVDDLKEHNKEKNWHERFELKNKRCLLCGKIRKNKTKVKMIDLVNPNKNGNLGKGLLYKKVENTKWEKFTKEKWRMQYTILIAYNNGSQKVWICEICNTYFQKNTRHKREDPKLR